MALPPAFVKLQEDKRAEAEVARVASERRARQDANELCDLFNQVNEALMPYDGASIYGHLIEVEADIPSRTVTFLVDEKRYITFTAYTEYRSCRCEDPCDFGIDHAARIQTQHYKTDGTDFSHCFWVREWRSAYDVAGAVDKALTDYTYYAN